MARETYPECYLHVTKCCSGETWIKPIRGNAKLDLTTQIKAWIKKTYGMELTLDGKVMPKIDGNYYAKILTDHRPPDSVIVWDSGGFYIKMRED